MKRKIELCGIYNIKNNLCTEDCKFCAQGILAKNRGSAKKITFDAKAIDAAMRAAENDLTRFGLVASSRGPSPEEVEIVVRIYREIKKRANIHLCASLGIASYEVMKKLKEAGVSRYHCNLEACKSFFKNLCTSHTYDEKVETIENAKKAGLAVCSGMLLGAGEPFEDRLELARELKELSVNSVPINILIPIKGTPLEDNKVLSEQEIESSITEIAKILSPEKIRLAGGRIHLKDSGYNLLKHAVSALITGDMATTAGCRVQNDKAMIKRLSLEQSTR